MKIIRKIKRGAKHIIETPVRTERNLYRKAVNNLCDENDKLRKKLRRKDNELAKANAKLATTKGKKKHKKKGEEESAA